jgi:hypothetical protein
MPEVNERDVEELRNKVREAEVKKVEEEKKLKVRIRQLEGEMKESQSNIDKLNLQLKEKDQECRLNALKIKELKRAVVNTKRTRLSPDPLMPN